MAAAIAAMIMPVRAAPAGKPFVPPTEPAKIAIVRSYDPSCAGACSDWIMIDGAIGPGTGKLFAETVARLHGRKLPVLINSPGGLINEAVRMGRLIRAKGLDVGVGRTAMASCPADRDACARPAPPGVVAGLPVSGPVICASACSFILAGGVRRYVPLRAYVGVHQFRTLQALVKTMRTFRVITRKVNGQTVEVSRTLIAERPISRTRVQVATPLERYEDAQRYFSDMGISPRLMELAEQTVPNAIHWLSLAELVSTKMDTEDKDGAFMIAHSGEPVKTAGGPPGNASAPSAATPAVSAMPTTRAVEDATLSADRSRDFAAVHVDGWVTWTVDEKEPSPALVGLAELSDNAGQVQVRIEDRGSRPGTPDYELQISVRPGRNSPMRDPISAAMPAARVLPSQPAIDFQAQEITPSPGNYIFDFPTQGQQAEIDRTLMKRAVALQFALIVYPGRTLLLSLACGKTGGQVFSRWRQLVDTHLLAAQGL